MEPIFHKVERLIAWRYLRARRRDGFISVIAGFSFAGIALGVATLIIVMAVMNGFRIELVNHILGVNGHITIAQYGRDIADYDDKIKKIEAIEGVNYASAIIEAQIMVTARNRNAGIVVRGHRQEDFQKSNMISDKITKGDIKSLSEGDVAIGVRLAQKLGVDVGDKVTLISPRGRSTPFGTAPRINGYRVGAIFELGMSLYDENFVFMGLDAAQKFFLKANTVSLIDVHIENLNETEPMKPLIYAALNDTFSAAGYLLTSWQESNKTYLSALAVERNVMFIILSLIILVASLNIVSGMIMLVKDKAQDIAILRTIGASRGAIQRIFFMSGAAIGVTGTVTGLIIGVLFCMNIEAIRQGVSQLLGIALFDPKIYFLARMPAEMTLTDVSSVVIMSLTLTFLAVIYPARRAAKLEPADVLRYE
ncbi:MAG: lipoprotein-releasing ABC transporter permease subunit [Pseudomonadota bacterium]